MIAILEPIFREDWAACGETLIGGAEPWTRPPWRAAKLAEFLADAERLDDALARYGQRLGCPDPRPVASAWVLDYCWALLPPVVAGASVLRHRLPVAADEIELALDQHGGPMAFRIPHLGASLADGATEDRYAPLLWAHLAPLVERLAQRGRVSPRLLWGNIARRLEGILEQAVLLTGGAAHVAADRSILLDRPAWPDGRPNPLFGKRRRVAKTVHGEPADIILHRQCCLYYRLPGQDYCQACPVAPGNRRGG
jgi:ferric iron reductase protein FhuF